MSRDGASLILPYRDDPSRRVRYTAEGDYLHFDGEVDAQGLPIGGDQAEEDSH